MNFAGLEFPIEVDKNGGFEHLNPEDAINIFAMGGKEIYNARVSDFTETPARTTINLLLIKREGRK